MEMLKKNKKLIQITKQIERGFSLVEIMVVVVIIGILATVVVKSVMNHLVKAHEITVKADFKTLSEAISLYKLDVHSLPNSIDDLSNNTGAKGWNGPYLENKPNDPNGIPYIYEKINNKEFILKSFGYDGIEGTDDDLSSRDEEENK